jgi:hypothetical protein
MFAIKKTIFIWHIHFKHTHSVALLFLPDWRLGFVPIHPRYQCPINGKALQAAIQKLGQ